MAGRPRKQIDAGKVAQLAELGCSSEEIAAQLDVGLSTIKRHFEPVLKKSRFKFHGKLRSQLAQRALAGDVTCLIFLSKCLLGLKEHPDTVFNVSATATGSSIVITEQQKKELANMARDIRRYAFADALGNGSNGDSSSN